MNQYYFIKPLASPRDARELTIHLKKQTEQTPFSIFGWRRDGDEAKKIPGICPGFCTKLIQMMSFSEAV